MKRLAVFILLHTIIFAVSAQIDKYGTPVSRSYSMKITQAAEQNWAITKDKFGSVWLGGEENFVNSYDGTKWTKVPLDQNNPTIVRALGADENGIIYVGGNDQFGYIEPDSGGTRVFKSLKADLHLPGILHGNFSMIPPRLNYPQHLKPQSENLNHLF